MKHPHPRPKSAPAPGKSQRTRLAIGAAAPRADAYTKVTGEERFAADYYGFDLLWAGVKRAGVPHARLQSIVTERAEQVPGVVRVLTHRDVNGTNRQGVIRKDQPVLVDDKVRHCGDAVAVVVAENKTALARALELIKINLEPLPAIVDPEEALLEGAALIHEDNPGGNVLLAGDLTIGAGESAAEDCDVLIEARFRTPRQEHAYLETEAGWAQQQDDGTLLIVCSTQTPFRDRTEVAEALGLDLTAVRIVAPYTGGAFGGKDGVTVQTLLGLAALHAGGRPVKMWWSREESFLAGTKRHPAMMYYRLGARADGTLHFLEARLFLDTGPYDHLGGVVLALALEHAGGPYRIPNAVLQGSCVYTNNPIGGAFRGFGVTQVTAAIEQMMDMLARRLNMDPIALRLKNAVRQGDRNCVGKTLVSSTGIVECLERLARHPVWTEQDAWKAAAGPFKRRGVGMAALMHGTGYGPVVPDFANAKVELTRDGTFRVYCGVVDMGQGNAASNAQIVGAILCQEADRIELVLPDTEQTLPSGSASASRCTYTFGNALVGATRILRDRILQRAADLLMVRGTDEVALVPGAVRCLRTGREIPLERLALYFGDGERVATDHFRAPVAGDAEAVNPEVKLRLHGLPHTLFSYAAHAAWIEVDEPTGQVRVAKYVAVSDCGTVLNPQIYEQQIQGGIAQGLGLALTEEFLVHDGRVVTPDFFTYILPTATDIPEIESIPVEIHEPTGPFGLKGVGEIATNGPLPVVANAVADACGVRIYCAPLTPERVRDAIAPRERKATA